MGIINEDGVILPRGGDHLHPALYMGHPGQDGGALLQRNSQSQGRSQHIQCVVNHEAPGNVHPDRNLNPATDRGKRHMVRLQNGIPAPKVRRAYAGQGFPFTGIAASRQWGLGLQSPAIISTGNGILFIVLAAQWFRGMTLPGSIAPPTGKGYYFTGATVQQAGRPRVRRVDNAGLTAAEQNGLGVAVGLHGLVKVQMILSQVGKYTHLVRNAIDTVQHQGVGGNLHHHIGASRVPHPGQEHLQLKGLGGGPLRRENLLSNHILVGADQAHGFSPGLQNGLEEVCGGGLPVGPGNPHHGHSLGRVAEEVSARHRQRPAGIPDPHPGNLPFRRRLAQHRRRPGGQGLRNKAVSVHRVAAEGYKQIPWSYRPGVIADAADLRLQIQVGGEDFQPRQQLF